MIVFLLIVYVGILVLLIKIKVLKSSKVVWLSIVPYTLLLLFALFIPMMFWAPSGNILVSQVITQMAPRVSGRIVKIHVQPNVPVKKGAPLITVDPTPYQDAVNSLKAQLAAAKQNVLQLKASLDAATSSVAQAKAQRESLKSSLDAAISEVARTKAQRDTLKATLTAATNTAAQAKAQRDLAAVNLKLIEDTRRENVAAVSKLKLEQSQQTLIEAEAGLQAALANEQKARVAYESEAVAVIQAAQANEQKVRTNYEGVSLADIQTAIANETKAKLAYTSEIDGVNTTVAQVTAQLAKAEFDLKETTVYAPADGFITDFVLAEGSAIAVVAGSAMLHFFSNDEPSYIIAGIEEKNLRYIEAGQPADVVMPLYPGETFTGKVAQVVWVTGEGQVSPQAGIPMVASRVKTGGQFGVKILLDEKWSKYRLPMGAGGSAAIYTEHGKPTHIIRKVMMRMNTWTNYLFQIPGQ